jgi:hypothetical protein
LSCELVLGYTEEVREFGDVFGRSGGLAVEERCDGYFVAAEGGGDGFEGEGFGGFGVEEGFGGGGEAVDEGGLEGNSSVFEVNTIVWCCRCDAVECGVMEG